MRTQCFPAGDKIFREGDDSRDAYRILSGRVDISIGTGGKRILLARLGPGDIFGEMALIEDKARSATATAEIGVEAEVMSPADFNRIILQDPARLLPYLASFFERLRTTNKYRLSIGYAILKTDFNRKHSLTQPPRITTLPSHAADPAGTVAG